MIDIANGNFQAEKNESSKGEMPKLKRLWKTIPFIIEYKKT